MTDLPAPAGPRVLAFSDRKAERRPVSTQQGVVGFLETEPWSSGFRVVDPTGAVICRGQVAFGSFGRRWEVVDAAGGPVLELTGWGRSATLEFAGGRACRVEGRMFRRAWSLTDATGATVLQSVPVDSGGQGFHPNSWLVEQDGSLTFVQFVAAVQTHRRAEARRRAVGNAIPV